MKEAIITDTTGLYVDVTLVGDAETGITPIYETPQPTDPDAEPPEEPVEPVEPTIIGYRVALPVIPGLYKPRFDLAAWEAYQAAIQQAQTDYAAAYATWASEDEETRGEAPMYVPPEAPTLWVEGLTPEGIEAINQPGPPSELEQVRSELTETQLALADTYEALLSSQDETTQTQLALADVYEQLLALQGGAS